MKRIIAGSALLLAVLASPMATSAHEYTEYDCDRNIAYVRGHTAGSGHLGGAHIIKYSYYLPPYVC